MENPFYSSSLKENNYITSKADYTNGNFERRTPPSDDNVSISIFNPTIKEGFRKYVIYTISGLDLQGTFEAYRRYKDFIRLRTLLVQHWPGCFIPHIPPKKMLGNLQSNFIEQRRKLLELFLNKIVSISYLYHSQEFHMFIRGPNEYHKTTSEFRRISLIQLSQTYLSVFADSPRVTPEEIATIDESYNYFKKALYEMELVFAACLRSLETFAEYEEHLTPLMNGLKDVNSLYVLLGCKEFRVLTREIYTNPYFMLLDYLKSEIMDLKAIIEAIHKKKAYDRITTKAEERLENERKKLQKIQQGNKSLAMIITNKPKDAVVEKLSSDIAELENELQAIYSITRIISSQLFSHEIPRFKKEKIYRFETVMRTFLSANIQELESLIAQTQKIDNAFNS
ncbi:unnamed protein product [Blepharisma stoltei]|uniref:PX domain-containing protein n=1 Tax=Blepharisma stoltei TaxID=1481888 RepID=A0AAU9IRL8_9CILI|nr:unnamed protein product [Blepharisma stoltei]